MVQKRQDDSGELHEPTDPYEEDDRNLDSLLALLRAAPVHLPRTPPQKQLHDRRKGPQDRRSAARAPSGM